MLSEMLLLRTCDLCKYQPIKILAILKIEQAVRWHRENSSEARAPRTRRLMQTARLEDHRSTNQGLGLANSPSESAAFSSWKPRTAPPTGGGDRVPPPARRPDRSKRSENFLAEKGVRHYRRLGTDLAWSLIHRPKRKGNAD